MTENLEWKGRIVVEFTEAIEQFDLEYDGGVALVGDDNLDVLAYQYNVYNISKFFPNSIKPADPSIRDLSRFYILEFPIEIDLHEVVQAYADHPLILTTKPYYIRKLAYTPNDPSFASQWAMANVNAELAFDYAQGSDSVIVGIVDSGTDTSHFDLKDNIWVNPGEDLNGNGFIDPPEWNGVDDDSNGYIDDFIGFDVWQMTNDVTDAGSHGTHCAGDAAARTDNGIGIASLGWQTKIMTAKAGDGYYIYASPQGINYCANNGADVISLSYGSYGSSPVEEAAIQNAWDQGALIFAAAGNESTTNPHYPSAFDLTVAVAATNASDVKAGFSNWGTWVDICAPGVDILSTIPPNTYASFSGTSMACPIAAGLACLLWSYYPEWTNEQIMVQIFDTCVNIDSLNLGIAGLLGYGRIDAGAALSQPPLPHFDYTQQEFDDTAGGNGDGRLDPGETIDVLITIENSSPTVAAMVVQVTLEGDDPDITILNGTNNWGTIPIHGTVNNHSDPLCFSIDLQAQSHEVTFTLTTSDSGSGLIISQEITQLIGRAPLIIVDDDGGLSYEQWYKNDLDSLDIVYEHWDISGQGEIAVSELVLYPAAIWYTSGEMDPLTVVEQAAIDTFLMSGGRLVLTGENIDEQLAGTGFYANILHAASTDSSGALLVLGIETDPISDGDSLYLSVGSGGAPNNNDPSTIDPVVPAELIYTYSNGLGAGIRWFEADNGSLVYLPFCFEAVTGAFNSTSRTEVLSSIFNWFDSLPQTGVNPGPDPELPLDYALDQNYPNPFNPATVINFSLPVMNRVKLSVFDLTGRKVATLVKSTLSAGQHSVTFEAKNLASGIYLYRIAADDFTTTRKMILLK